MEKGKKRSKKPEEPATPPKADRSLESIPEEFSTPEEGVKKSPRTGLAEQKSPGVGSADQKSPKMDPADQKSPRMGPADQKSPEVGPADQKSPRVGTADPKTTPEKSSTRRPETWRATTPYSATSGSSRNTPGSIFSPDTQEPARPTPKYERDLAAALQELQLGPPVPKKPNSGADAKEKTKLLKSKKEVEVIEIGELHGQGPSGAGYNSFPENERPDELGTAAWICRGFVAFGNWIGSIFKF